MSNEPQESNFEHKTIDTNSSIKAYTVIIFLNFRENILFYLIYNAYPNVSFFV